MVAYLWPCRLLRTSPRPLLEVLPLKTSPVCGACRTPPNPRPLPRLPVFPVRPRPVGVPRRPPRVYRLNSANGEDGQIKDFGLICLLATGPTAAFTAEPTWPIMTNLFPKYMFAGGLPCRPRGGGLRVCRRGQALPKGPGRSYFTPFCPGSGSAWLSHSKL